MPVTQYIGARYVPIIYQNPDDNTNNWKQGVPYEPLTIVSYAGGSYTSKSAVPAGAANPVDAPEYWVSIGLYSGQTSINTNNIDHIQHALANATEAGYVCTTARAEGDLVWINGILYECTAAVNVNDSYTEGINITQVLDALHGIVSSLDQCTSDISDLGGAVTTLSGMHNFTTRKFIFLSDSYGLVPDVNTSWIGRIKTYLNIPDDNFYRSEENGSGFIGLVANTFKAQMQTLAGSMSADERNAITDIVIGGGYNDAAALKNGTSVPDMNAAINSTLSYIRTTFPNSLIYVFMPGWNIDATTHSYIRSIINCYQQNIFGASRVSYIEGVDWCHRLAFLDSTKYHPNATGAYCIAKSVASVLVGGSPFCDLGPNTSDGYITPYMTVSSAITNYTFDTMKQLYSNGMAYMFWKNIKFDVVNNLWNGTSVDLGEFDDGIMSGGPFLEGYTTRVYDALHNHFGILSIYGNKLRFTNIGSDITAGSTVELFAGSMCGPITL